MGKKMNLIPFLSKSSETTWPWRCGTGSPRTLSFRAAAADDPDTFNFTVEPSASTDSPAADDDCVEKVIKSLLRSSERLFFEPAAEAAVAAAEEEFPLKETVAVSVDSTNPSRDFRRSMEEMVTAHHHRHRLDDTIVNPLDWKFLEELLTCFLKINGKGNHGYIVGAFVELLVSLSPPDGKNKSQSAIVMASASPSSSSSSSSSDENCLLCNSHSFTFPLSVCSSNSSPCFSSSQEAHQDETIQNSQEAIV